MKTRIFLGILASILFFGCSQEESIEEIEAVNAGVSITPFVCDPDWQAPVALFPVEKKNRIHITYDSSLPKTEINCIRQEYFERYECLRMALRQPGDFYHDIWAITCDETDAASVAETVKNTANNDSQVCAAPPSECN